MNTDLKNLTSEQLRQLKESEYQAALNAGHFVFIGEVAKYLGVKQNHIYGPKYKWNYKDIEIYLDNYGGYMTVHEGGKLKASTHNERLFARGGWFERIKETVGDSLNAVKTKELYQEEKAKQQQLVKTILGE